MRNSLAVLILGALSLGAYNYVPTRSALEKVDKPRPAQEEMILPEQKRLQQEQERRPGSVDPEAVPLNQRHDTVEDKKRGELVPYGIK